MIFNAGCGDCEELISGAIERKMNFVVRYISGRTIVKFPNRRYEYSLSSNKMIKDAWFINFVSKDVEKRVESGDYVPKETNNERIRVNSILFSLKNNITKAPIKVKYIDITSCYFTTAHKIGVISDNTYERGKNLNKKTKNVSIGALGAREEVLEYQQGKEVSKKTARRPLNVVRLDIIDHVWSVANNIINKISDGFMFFLTDAFIVKPEYSEQVCQLLHENGYDFKIEDAEVYGIEMLSKNCYKVSWKHAKKDYDEDKPVSWHEFSIRNVLSKELKDLERIEYKIKRNESYVQRNRNFNNI